MLGRQGNIASTPSHSHFHARHHHHEPAMRLYPRTSPPCPGASGQTIGTGLLLTLTCGSSLEGEVLATLPEAATLPQCADFCGTFHPRCDGVNFSEAGGCRLIGGVGSTGVSRSSLSDDSATAEYPSLPPSSCRDGDQRTSGGVAFEGMCGQVINGGDIRQRHQTTYEDCAADCAETAACVAFSFEASMDRGYMNCYLKSSLDDGALSFVDGVDSGLMSAGAVSPPPPPANDISEIPNSGGFFTIVPGGGAAVQVTDDPEAPLVSEGSPASEDPAATTTSAPAAETPITTQVVTASLAPPSGSAEVEAASSGSANLSWVAAPVVGGVAAMLVVGVLIIMFRKRRHSSGSRGEGGESMASRGGDGWKSMFGALGGLRGRGMERLDDTESSRGVPVYEVKGGKVALRGTGEERQRPLTGLFRTES